MHAAVRLQRVVSYRGRVTSLVLATLVGGCPVTPSPTRDGGTPCTASAECNAGGVRCGSLFLCVQGFCARTPTIVACADGAYPDAAPAGNCLTYEDCNPLPRCGAVINCVSFRCDPEGPRLEVPCRDGGADATDARSDASADAGGDARSDASVEAGADATSDAIGDAEPDAAPDGVVDGHSG